MRVADGFTILGVYEAVISSVDSWFPNAPPKGRGKHWVDGRSAKELARAWFSSGRAAPPQELLAVLDGLASIEVAELTHGIAEHETRFDSYGTGRNHDLVLQIRHDDGGKIVVGIEAKVDEPLDRTVFEKVVEAEKIIDAGERTNLKVRVEELMLALFGRSLEADPRLGNLRYQLVTAAAGTLVEAKKRDARAALLVVHDLSVAGHASNVLDTSDFVNALGGNWGTLIRGRFYGPLTIAGGGRIPSDIPLSVAVVAAVDRRSATP